MFHVHGRSSLSPSHTRHKLPHKRAHSTKPTKHAHSATSTHHNEQHDIDTQLQSIRLAYEQSNTQSTQLSQENVLLRSQNQRLLRELTQSNKLNTKLTTQQQHTLQQMSTLRTQLVTTLNSLYIDFTVVLKKWRESIAFHRNKQKHKNFELYEITEDMKKYQQQLYYTQHVLLKLKKQIKYEKQCLIEQQMRKLNKQSQTRQQQQQQQQHELSEHEHLFELTGDLQLSPIPSAKRSTHRRRHTRECHKHLDHHNDSNSNSSSSEYEYRHGHVSGRGGEDEEDDEEYSDMG